MNIVIREAQAADEAAFRILWSAYLRFYQAELPAAVTDLTWARILDPAAPVFARLAVEEGVPRAFAVCVVHEGTWAATPICYLEDLYVEEAARGRGIGRRLIEDLVDRVRERGWTRLYWHTEADNRQARALYDRFTPADGVRYRIKNPAL